MPFQKGNTLLIGNRGRAHPQICTQELASQLNEIEPKTGKATKHRLIARLIQNGLDGDTAAMKEVFDRIEGKAPQALEVSSDRETHNYTLDPTGHDP